MPYHAAAFKLTQGVGRKRALEKIQLDEIRPSSRKYPYIDFRPEREIGNDVLFVEGISKDVYKRQFPICPDTELPRLSILAFTERPRLSISELT